MVNRLAWMVRRVSEGQQLDIEFEDRIAVSEEDYFEMIEGKTAVMFLTCAEIGSRMSGADDETIQCMADWGLAVGLCFQLMDDLIDVLSDSDTLGKPAGSDIAQGKRLFMHFQKKILHLKEIYYLFWVKETQPLKRKLMLGLRH